MTVERALIIRNALANSILDAGTDVFKNTKDLTVKEYWLHCYYVNEEVCFNRLIEQARKGIILQNNVTDILNYIAENK